MKIECRIDLYEVDNFDEEHFFNSLRNFLENNEQTYYRTGLISVETDDCCTVGSIDCNN